MIRHNTLKATQLIVSKDIHGSQRLTLDHEGLIQEEISEDSKQRLLGHPDFSLIEEAPQGTSEDKTEDTREEIQEEISEDSKQRLLGHPDFSLIEEAPQGTSEDKTEDTREEIQEEISEDSKQIKRRKRAE